MKKEFKKFWGLDGLREGGTGKPCCPDCHNYLTIVLNGLFEGELFFCTTCKKIYNIALKDITKLANADFINQCEEDASINKLRDLINKNNYKQIEKFIKDIKK